MRCSSVATFTTAVALGARRSLATRLVFGFAMLLSLTFVAARVAAQEAATKTEAKAETKLHSAIKPEPREGNWMKRHESFNTRVKQGNADLLFIRSEGVV